MRDDESIFAEAVRLESAQQRQEFLDRTCGTDAQLRAKVQALLSAHDSAAAGGFLESPTSDIDLESAIDDAPAEDHVGSIIDGYELLEQIGEGGMGVVYMAEQLHPVQRRVALKIIKPGMDTKRVIARFEAERQALAMMDHPNIAKVFDAGTTDNGRPYFVMELVRGIPITDYCDQNQLTPRQRLELFIQVCQAVQHAHQKGIIHRDLKPTNVLVTQNDDRPTPKVIDFGIAKATGGERLTEQTLYTELRQLVGTPSYMSPEQAEMSAVMDVDTRSDVYSLGVLLYELLTGTTPFDKQRLAQAALDEVRRILREEEPPRPSTRISTLGQTLTGISAQRQTDPRKLSTILRGELDWIVMRALEKDRVRRYESASGLASDVERYLVDQPVQACPPSRAYRLRKFARRNKAAIATGALIAAVLVIATALSTWAAVRANRAEGRIAHERDNALAEKQRADEQAAIAQAINDFLDNDVLDQASPESQVTPLAAPDPNFKVRDALDRAEQRLAQRFDGQPRIKAAIRQTIGEAYATLGELQKAERQLNEALRIRREKLGEDNLDTLRSTGMLGNVYRAEGRYDEAERLHQRVLEGRRKLLGKNDPRTLMASANLAGDYVEGGEYDRAIPLCLMVLQANREAHREQDDGTLLAMMKLGDAYNRTNQLAKAEPIWREVLDLEQRLKGPHHPETSTAQFMLAQIYFKQGRNVEAEPLFRSALEDYQRQGGPSGNELAIVTELYLARIAARGGRSDEAKRLLVRPAEAFPKLWSEHARNAFLMANLLAETYARIGQYDKAEPLLIAVLEEHRRTLGVQNEETLRDISNLGAIYGNLDLGKAIKLLEQARDGQISKLGADHPSTLVTLYNLGLAYRAAGRLEEAIKLLEQVRDAQIRKLGPDHAATLTTPMGLAEMYQSAGRSDDAIRSLEQMRDAQISKLGPNHPEILALLANIAYLRVSAGDLRQAASDLAEVMSSDPEDHWIWFRYGCLLAYLGEDKKYRDLRDSMAKRFGDSRNPDIADRMIKTALLLPTDDAGQSGALLRRLEPLMRVLESNADNPWRLQVRGIFQYRAGRHADAIQLLKRSIEMFGTADEYGRVAGVPTSQLFLALALRASGADEKMVNDAVHAALNAMNKGPIEGPNFQDRLVIEVALREARQVLKLDIPSDSQLTFPTTRPTTRPRPRIPATVPAIAAKGR